MDLDPVEVTVVANAIGYAMFAGDGRDLAVCDCDAMDFTINCTLEETLLVKNAAIRALTQLEEHRSLV